MPRSSRSYGIYARFVGLTAATLGLVSLAASACGDDDAVVRARLDGSADEAAAGEAGSGTLACGVTIPTVFAAPNFTANAAAELALANNVELLDTSMASTEGTSTAVVSAGDLAAIYNAGAPSLRSVSTSTTQTTVDAYLAAFGAAGGKVWQPTDGDQDGGALAGGKYAGLFYESSVGIDLRSATGKALLGGALYNQALGIVASTVTDASVDRLLALFGASQALANRTDVDAGVDSDRFLAALASKREDKDSPTPGIYSRIRTALLTMKAATAAGDKCKAELDAAVASFRLEWEHATYASAIFSLNAAATSAADPSKGALSLHSFGDAVGLIQSFKGLQADKRKITDGQIDTIIAKIGADSPYKLVTSPGTRVLALTDAINDIALFETFDAAAVESFKKSF